MKGKLAFVLGAAVGYVLGTRAGRERYEQIKRGAQRIWRTEPVQRGVHLVKDAVDDRADELKAFAVRLGNDVFSNLAKNRADSRGTAEGGDGRAAETAAEDAPPTAPESPASTPPTARSSKSSSAKPSSAKPAGSGSSKSASSGSRSSSGTSKAGS